MALNTKSDCTTVRFTFDPTRSRKRTFLEPLRVLRSRYMVTSLIALLQAGYGIVLVWFTAALIGAFERNDFGSFQRYVVAFACYMIFFYVMIWITKHFNTDTDYMVSSGLKQYLYGKFIAMDNNQVEAKGTGRIVNIIGDGVAAWNNLLRFSTRRLLRECMTVIFALIFIFTVSLLFFGVAIGYIIIMTGLLYLLNKKVHYMRKEKKQIDVEESRHKLKVLMSKFEVLQSGKLQQELNNVANFVEKKRVVQRQINNYNYSMYHLPSAGATGVRFAIMMVVGLAIFAGSQSIEQFAALMGAMGYLSSMIFRLTDSHRFWQEKIVHLEKLYDFLEETTSIKGLTTGTKFSYKKGNISIANLRFGYNDELIFDNLSLELTGGKKTAFVGESGSGKSTLMKLIAGYLHPDDGKISIDGQSLSETKLESYYPHIGYLTQEPSVFDGTILENIMYATTKNVSEKEIKKAIKLAQCDFVYDFKDGIHTEIGERGIKLSGGQRQRLAIAKIFLKNPEIILLDEPTSALDSVSEESITQAMHNLFAGRTVIVIAHRLQTVKEADDIIVFDKGCVVERGTHKQLLEHDGHYAKMLRLQSGF